MISDTSCLSSGAPIALLSENESYSDVHVVYFIKISENVHVVSVLTNAVCATEHVCYCYTEPARERDASKLAEAT